MNYSSGNILAIGTYCNLLQIILFISRTVESRPLNIVKVGNPLSLFLMYATHKGRPLCRPTHCAKVGRHERKPGSTVKNEYRSHITEVRQRIVCKIKPDVL